jgi:hypothetical protein
VRRDPVYGPGPWPAEPTGTVIVSPYDGTESSTVMTVRGPEPQYVVEFDHPQLDAEGDGPYTMSQVRECYLEAI